MHHQNSISTLLFCISLLQGCNNSPAPLGCKTPDQAGGNGHVHEFGLPIQQKQASLTSPLHASFRGTSTRITTDLAPTTCTVAGQPSGTNEVAGPFSLPLDKTITFDRINEQWQANVKDAYLKQEETLPVVSKGDVSAILSTLQGARAVDVSSRIHLLAPDQAPRCVYVGALGVRGGGKKRVGKGKKNRKGNMRVGDEVTQNQTNTASSEAISDTEGTNTIAPHLIHMLERAKNKYIHCSIRKSLEEWQVWQATLEPLEVPKAAADSHIEIQGIIDNVNANNVNANNVNNNSLDKMWELLPKEGKEESIGNTLFEFLKLTKDYLEIHKKKAKEWLYPEEHKRNITFTPTNAYLFKIHRELFEWGNPIYATNSENTCNRIKKRHQSLSSMVVNLFHAKLANEGKEFTEETQQLIEELKYFHPLFSGGDFVEDKDACVPKFVPIISLLQSIQSVKQEVDLSDPIAIWNEIICFRKARDWASELKNRGAKKGELVSSPQYSKESYETYVLDPQLWSSAIIQLYCQQNTQGGRLDGFKKFITDFRRIKNIEGHIFSVQPCAHFIRTIYSLNEEGVLKDEYAKHFSDKKSTGSECNAWLTDFLAALQVQERLPEFQEGDTFFSNQDSISFSEDEDSEEEEEIELEENSTSSIPLDNDAVHQQPSHANEQSETIEVSGGRLRGKHKKYATYYLILS